MPISLSCPSCQKPYQVPDTLAGKQVRCQKCSQVFTVAAPPPAALDPLLAADLPPLGPALPASSGITLPSGGLGAPLAPSANPLGFAPSSYAPADYSPSAGMPGNYAPGGNPSGGPTNTGIRIGGACGIGLGVLLLLLCVITHVTMDTVYLWPLMIAPIVMLLGAAALVDPNITRALGKYGAHLPIQYKLLGWGLIGLGFLIDIGIAIALLANGFRPGR